MKNTRPVARITIANTIKPKNMEDLKKFSAVDLFDNLIGSDLESDLDNSSFVLWIASDGLWIVFDVSVS